MKNGMVKNLPSKIFIRIVYMDYQSLMVLELKKFNIVANPGCYPTSISLGLMPLLKNNLINTKNIICDSNQELLVLEEDFP